MSAEWKKTLIVIKERLMGSPRAIMLLVTILILFGFLSQISWFSHSIAPTIVGLFLSLVTVSLIVFLLRALKIPEEGGAVTLGDMPGSDPAMKPNKLTKLVKIYIDVIWFLLLALAILLPFIGAVLSIDYFEGKTGNWGVDLAAFWGFTIDLEQLTDMDANIEGLRHGVISGKTMINIETFSVVAWYLFIAINEVMLLIAVYCLTQMRGLFAGLVKGLYFSIENSYRLRKIGFAVIFANIIIPIMQYFGGQRMLGDIKFDIPGFEIYPALDYSGDGIFLGLLIVILSGVAREAANIYQDQMRTI